MQQPVVCAQPSPANMPRRRALDLLAAHLRPGQWPTAAAGGGGGSSADGDGPRPPTAAELAAGEHAWGPARTVEALEAEVEEQLALAASSEDPTVQIGCSLRCYYNSFALSMRLEDATLADRWWAAPGMLLTPNGTRTRRVGDERGMAAMRESGYADSQVYGVDVRMLGPGSAVCSAQCDRIHSDGSLMFRGEFTYIMSKDGSAGLESAGNKWIIAGMVVTPPAPPPRNEVSRTVSSSHCLASRARRHPPTSIPATQSS